MMARGIEDQEEKPEIPSCILWNGLASSVPYTTQSLYRHRSQSRVWDLPVSRAMSQANLYSL